MQVAVVYSLPTKRLLSTPYGAIDEDSAFIAKKVAMALTSRGMAVTLYPIAEDRIADISKIRADCVFNLIEWCGQDIPLASEAFKFLRKLEIPVTGSPEKQFVLTGDKARLKTTLLAYDLPTPRGMTMETGEEPLDPALQYPVIVKPSVEHCSVGLSYEAIANKPEEVQAIAKRQIVNFRQPAVVEEFVAGREFEVYLLEVAGEVQVLPIEEVIFGSRDPMAFQTYDCKWTPGSGDYEQTNVVRAVLAPEEQKAIEHECRRAFTALEFRGYARFDVRMRDGVPYLLETNANPAVYDGDKIPFDPEDEVIFGIRFADYVDIIVQSALWHYDHRWVI